MCPVPCVCVQPVGCSAMGVGSKAEADVRLAALKAEMRGEVGERRLTPLALLTCNNQGAT